LSDLGLASFSRVLIDFIFILIIIFFCAVYIILLSLVIFNYLLKKPK